MDEEGNPRVVRGIPKVISVRQISAMQLKKFCSKGCRLYAAHVLEAMENETPRLEDFHVLQEFMYVFLNEILGLPPKRDIDFIIDLVLGAALVSKTPYRMSTPYLLELNMRLQEFRDVFLDEILGLPLKRDIILQFTFCREPHQCPRHPTG